MKLNIPSAFPQPPVNFTPRPSAQRIFSICSVRLILVIRPRQNRFNRNGCVPLSIWSSFEWTVWVERWSTKCNRYGKALTFKIATSVLQLIIHKTRPGLWKAWFLWWCDGNARRRHLTMGISRLDTRLQWTGGHTSSSGRIITFESLEPNEFGTSI